MIHMCGLCSAMQGSSRHTVEECEALLE